MKTVLLPTSLLTLAGFAGALVSLADETRAQALDTTVVTALRRGPAHATMRGDSTAVPIVGSRTVPLIEARINGRGPYRLLIDLGSNVTLLRRDVVGATSTTVLVERATSDIIRIDSLEIGGAVFTAVTGASYDELDVDGVLGFNLVRAFCFTMDYPAMRFSFHRDTLPAPNGRDVLPYAVVGRMPYVRAVSGTDTLLLNVNTGAVEWMTVPMPWKDRLRWETEPTPGPRVANNQTGATAVLVGVLATSLRLGGFVFDRPRIYLNPDADDGWLGNGLLQHFTLTFDTRNDRVRLASTHDTIRATQ